MTGYPTASNKTQQEIVQNILRAAATLLNADRGATLQVLEGDFLRTFASVGLSEKNQHFVSKRGEGSGGRVVENGEPLVVQDYDNFGRHPNSSLPPHTTLIALPIYWEEECLGVVQFFADNLRRVFSDQDVELAQSFAAQFEIMLVNARLIQREQEARLQAETLQAVAFDLSMVTTTSDILECVARHCRAVLPGDRITVQILEPGRPLELYLEGVPEQEMAETAARFKNHPIHNKVLDLLSRSDKPVLIPDTREDLEWAEMVEMEPPTLCWIGVPLVIREEFLGVLSFSSHQSHSYGEPHTRLAGALGTVVARTVQNLLLLEKTLAHQRRFEDIVVSTTDGVWEIDTKGNLLYCSDSLLQTLGYPSDAVPGLHLRNLSSQAEFERLKKVFKDSLASDLRISELEHTLRRRNGVLRVFRSSAVVIQGADGSIQGLRGVSRDISARKDAEQRELLASAIGQRLTSVLSIDDLLGMIVDQVRDTLNYYHVRILLYEADGGVLVDQYNSLSDSEQLPLEARRIPVQSPSFLVAQAARMLEPVVVNNVHLSESYIPNPFLPETLAEAAFPLFRGRRLLGVLDVMADAPNRFTDQEIRLLGNLAAQASISIENARLYQALEQQADHLEELVMERSSQIISERERLRAIVGYAGEGILFFSPNGTVEYANPAWGEITGLPPEDIIGRTFSAKEVLRYTVNRGIVRDIFRAIGEGMIWSGEIRTRRPDGSEYDLAATLTPVEGRDGRVENYVSLVRDVSAQKEVERMRSTFIAKVSHELRTPIANLKLYNTLLKSGPIEKHGHYLDTIADQINRLQRLVEDLLDLSRIDRGVIVMSPAFFDLNLLVEEALRTHQIAAQHRGLRFRLELQPDLPPVYADRERMMQVLTNLLTNAVNYTVEGDDIGVRTQLEGTGFALLEVWDSGSGIAREDLPFIFNRFFRAESAKVAAIPGTGLGLSIVKEIVDAHGGDVSVQSTPLEGSVFKVRLPLDKRIGITREL